MLFSKKTVLTAAAAFSGLVQGAKITVAVGKDGLSYEPAEITAKVGDFVTFEFYPASHSVAMSTFDKPCQALSSGFYSGTLPGANPPTDSFTIEIKDTSPIWFFCATIGHCEAGMSGVINAGGGNTLAAYQAASKKATTSDPGKPRGGAEPPSGSSTPSGSPSASESSSGGSKPTSTGKPTSTSKPSKPTSGAPSSSSSSSSSPSPSTNVTTTSTPPPTNTSGAGSALTNAAAELVLGAAVAIAFLLA